MLDIKLKIVSDGTTQNFFTKMSSMYWKSIYDPIMINNDGGNK